MPYQKSLTIQTKGYYDFIDITNKVAALVAESKVDDGLVNIFVPGSTATVTTMEYEQGIMQDIKNVLEKLAPENADYEHHQRWGDHNGAAHIKAALMGPSINVPFKDGQIHLGTWQQIVVIDFDEKPRERKIIISVI